MISDVVARVVIRALRSALQNENVVCKTQTHQWPHGLMVKALASGAGDCMFEFWRNSDYLIASAEKESA